MYSFQTEDLFLSTPFILLSANAFNLEKSKTLLCCKELIIVALTLPQILDSSKLKEFADDNSEFD